MTDHFVLFQIDGGDMIPVAKINETDREIANMIVLSSSYKPHHKIPNIFLDNDNIMFALIAADPNEFKVKCNESIQKEIEELYNQYVDTDKSYCWFVSSESRYYYVRSLKQYCAHRAIGFVNLTMRNTRHQIEDLREIFEYRYHQFLQKNKFEKISLNNLTKLFLRGSQTKPEART